MQFGALRSFDAADIMAGCQTIGAQVARDLEQVGELHAHVTFDAGDGRPPRHIFVGKVGDDRFPETAFIIEDIMGDADTVSDSAGVAYILPRAAAASAADSGAMIVKL